MSFDQLKRRVERGEALVEGRIRQTTECHARLSRTWRESWTPLRIVVAGLAAGFITGRAEPEKALKKLGDISNPRTLQIISSVAGMVGTLQAAIVAMAGNQAADAAQQAAAAADAATPNDQGPAGPSAPASGDEPAADPAAHPDPATTADSEAAPLPDRGRADPQWDSQPSPAEAATELSER